MVIDRLENAHWYLPLGGRIATGLQWLQEQDLEAIAPGRHEVDGDRIYAMVLEYDTQPEASVPWEAHRKYLDIQYIVRGAERIGYANLGALSESEPYNEEKDVVFLCGDGDLLRAPAGAFLIFGPEDAHKPGVAAECPASRSPGPAVRKIVVKIRM